MSKSTKVFVPKGTTFEVCPWAYVKCNLPAGKFCPDRKRINGAKDIQQWGEATRKAQGCQHQGEKITRKQYEHRQMGVVV